MARYVKVATVSLGGIGGPHEGYAARMRERAAELLKRAALERPDIVCLPETFTGLGLPQDEWLKTAEPVPGPTTEAMARIAKRHRMFVACPILRREGDRVYNSAVLLDRRGEVVGIYNKNHPTIGEIERGITPGTEVPVFETDFGKVGFAICFDLNFPDVAEGLKQGGAELVLFPSMFRGGLILRIWAYLYGFYIASATPKEGSMIVDPLGRVLVQSWDYQPIICRTINLDSAVLHINYSQEKWPEIKRKYGPKVEIDISAPEGVFMLTSHHPKVSVDDIIEEFGLERRDEYFQRAEEVRRRALRRLWTRRSERRR